MAGMLLPLGLQDLHQASQGPAASRQVGVQRRMDRGKSPFLRLRQFPAPPDVGQLEQGPEVAFVAPLVNREQDRAAAPD